MAGKGSLAEEIRTGLSEKVQVSLSLVSSSPKKDPLDELYFRKSIRQHVKEFVCIFAIITLIMGGYRIYWHSDMTWGLSLAAFAVLLLGLGYLAPNLIRPVWKGWMRFAEKISIVMSVVILGIAWIVALIPIAIMLRFFRTKVMDLRFNAPVESYWEMRDPKHDDFKLLKRQF
ncbi:MAG: hypothetical protein GYA55_10450 [SAR324 cluster bacterium]|uniref:SxtJ n=1 Tax=SAR324 cluster bacterium TaxID=2024889 RepID=A0A7X9FSY8_9DELT|nr:hypothetical protein [SAR324 cluster bacterium]